MTAPAPPRPARPRLVLAVVLVAAFVQVADISIVNTAIPSLQSDLDTSIGQLQLVLSGYTLAFACVLITAARLGDVHGRRRLFLVGMTGFTVASALCGLAPTGAALITARVLQGLASGLMFPQVLAVIQVAFAGGERRRALAVFGTTVGLATVLGPLLGGLLIELDLGGLGWRSVFLVNVPLGLAALVVARRHLPESRAEDAPRLDLVGALLSTGGLFLLVYPLAEGRGRGWPLWTVAMLVAAGPVLVAFVVLQRRATAAGRSPLLPTTLFRGRSFSVGSALVLVFFLGLTSFFFVLALYLQIGLGRSALEAGLTSVPFALGSLVAAAPGDRLARRLGTRVLSLGLGLLLAGTLLLMALVADRGERLELWQAWPPLFVAGLGLGVFLAPVTALVLAGVPRPSAGAASGVLSSVNQVGASLGVALVGTLYLTLLGGAAGAAAAAEQPRLERAAVAAGFAPGLAAEASRRFADCFARQVDSADPRRPPADCRAAAAQAAAFVPAAGEVLLSAVDRARSDAFATAFQRVLWWQVGVWGLASLLVLALPRVRPEALPEDPAARLLA